MLLRGWALHQRAAVRAGLQAAIAALDTDGVTAWAREVSDEAPLPFEHWALPEAAA